MNITSSTPLFRLHTSFCLHSYLLVCSFNHRLTAKKWWINDNLWEESISYSIFFSFKKNFKCSHRYTNIPAGLYSACLFERASLRIETVFSYYTKPPCLFLLANSNTTFPSIINLTLVLAFQINYKVTSIIQNFYPLSSYLLQRRYLQMQLSDPGYPLGLSHSQLFGLHGCSLQVTITTFCKLYACQEWLAKGMDKVKKPANTNQTNLNVFLYLSWEGTKLFVSFYKEASRTLSTNVLHKI